VTKICHGANVLRILKLKLVLQLQHIFWITNSHDEWARASRL